MDEMKMYQQEFKYVFRLFWFCGMHPGQKLKKPLVAFNFVLTLYITVLILMRILITGELVVMESIGVFSQIWLKFVVLTTKRRNLRILIQDTQKFWQDDVEGGQNQKLLRYLNKGSKIFLSYIFLSTCMFLFKPLLDRGTTIYYYYIVPGVPFFVSYAIEFYVTLVTMSMVIGCNLIIPVLIVIVAGQFSNLNARLRMIDCSKIETVDDFKACLKELRENIQYHGFLMDYVDRINEIFTMLFVILMAIVTALLCMNMYVISMPNTTVVDYVRAGTMVCALTTEFLLLYGFPAQALLDEAENVANSVFYHTNWYVPNVIPIRKTLMLMIHRSQKSVCLSAGGLVDINRQTVVAMVKTAYSFFTFLQTMETTSD